MSFRLLDDHAERKGSVTFSAAGAKVTYGETVAFPTSTTVTSTVTTVSSEAPFLGKRALFVRVQQQRASYESCGQPQRDIAFQGDGLCLPATQAMSQHLQARVRPS